jgi:hypothetical protein
MTSPTFVEVPGLNFDWLNLDTEQGMKVQAGGAASPSSRSTR